MTVQQAFEVALQHHQSGRLAEAEAIYRQILAVEPGHADALHLLGVIAHQAGQGEVAVNLIRQAIALNPGFPSLYSNLGVALEDLGQLDSAIAAYRKAINPDYPEAHYNLALALLLAGNFREGWEEHEWRWRVKSFPSPARNFAQPQWDGSHLEGRTLLLHAEQGFGDAFQFIRYLPLVQGRGGQVVIECKPELLRMFKTMAPDLPVVARGQNLPPFDVHCPLLSLPRLFATDLTNIPRTVPYLAADAEDAGRWKKRLANHLPSLKVGLVWAGSHTHPNDRTRSLKLASFAPLAEIPGVQFFSLQKGTAAAEATTPPKAMALTNFSGELNDFADTAALIANLDLVISVDTSVVHLAGAMGRPVWTLLPFAPDWRWLRGREDSPWYPTMRLFRQSNIRDWTPVIARVREQLAMLAQSRKEKP